LLPEDTAGWPMSSKFGYAFLIALENKLIIMACMLMKAFFSVLEASIIDSLAKAYDKKKKNVYYYKCMSEI